MKRVLSFVRKKASQPESSEESQFAAGYELNKKDLSQVHKAALDGDLVKLAELTTAKKKDINQLDKQHRTALHIASAVGHDSVVNFIVKNKGQLDILDAQNRTALMKAVQGQHDKCVRILLDYGAVLYLVDINGNSALHLAANVSSVSIAEMLLKCHIDINTTNNHSLTPLALAVCDNHIEMVEFLLKNGADVNAADNKSSSPLMIAAGKGLRALIQLLLRYEADISLKDNRGLSAKDYAEMNQHQSCFDLITDHETQTSNEVSSLHQDQSDKEILSAASQNSEVGGSEDGAATDEDENEDSRGEEDFEEDFEPESSSVASKSGKDGQRKQESGMRCAYTLEDLDWDTETEAEDQLLDSDAELGDSRSPQRKVEIERSKEEETSSFQQEPSPASVPPQTNSPSMSGALSRVRETSYTDSSDFEVDDQPTRRPKMIRRLSLSQRNLNSSIFRRASSLADLSLSDEETETEPAPKFRSFRSQSSLKVQMEECRSSDAHCDEEKSDQDESLQEIDHTLSEVQQAQSPDFASPIDETKSPASVTPQRRTNTTSRSPSLSWGSYDSDMTWSDCEKKHDLPTTQQKMKRFNLNQRKTIFSKIRKGSERVDSFLSGQESESDQIGSALTPPRTSPHQATEGNEMIYEQNMSAAEVETVERQSINVDHDEEKSDQDESSHETKETTYKPSLSGCRFNQNRDLMEELGVTDADFLADASDCDSDSTIRDHTLLEVQRDTERFPETFDYPIDKSTSPALVSPQPYSPSWSGAVSRCVDRNYDDWSGSDVSADPPKTEKITNSSTFMKDSTQDDLSLSDEEPQIMSSPTRSTVHVEMEEHPIDKNKSSASLTALQSASLSWRSYHSSMNKSHFENNDDSLTLENKMKSFILSQRKISSSKIGKGSKQDDKFLTGQDTELEPALQTGSSLTLPRIRSPEIASPLLSSFQEQRLSTDDGCDLHNNMSGQEEENEEEQQEREQDLDVASYSSKPDESEPNFENASHSDSHSITRGYTLPEVQQEPSNGIEDFPETEIVPQICTSPTLRRVSLAQMTYTHLSSFEKPEVSPDENSDLYDYLSGQEEEYEEEEQELEEDYDATFCGSEAETSTDNEEDSMAELCLEIEEAVQQVVDSGSFSEDIDLLLTESENKTVNEEEPPTFELEMRTLVDDMEQLEEEDSTSTAEEDLLNSHLYEQLELEGENSDSDEQEQTFTLQEQIRFTRGDLECAQANCNLKEMRNLSEENEALKDQLLEAQREIKANNDARIQAVRNYKSLRSELDSARAHLAAARQEAERSSAAKADAEEALLKEKEENQRLKDRLIADSAIHREAVSSLSQKLSNAEFDVNSLKNELHQFTLRLMEKDQLLNVAQKEKQHLAGQVEKLEKTLQAQKELLSKTGARYEAMQERVSLMEERNRELASTNVDLQSKVFRLEEEKSQGEVSVRKLQQELKDTMNKLSKSEASLQVNTRCRSDLEEENAQVRKDLETLKEKLAQTVDENVQAEQRLSTLKSSFTEKKKELTVTIQRLQEALSESESATGTVKKLEETVQRLEFKNARLEEDLQTQVKRETSLLEKETRKGQKKINELTEQKNIADARLDEEVKRNAELNNDKSRMTTLLQKAKMKLREQQQEKKQRHQELQEVRQQLELAKRQQSQVSHEQRHKLEQRNRELETEASRSRATLLDSLTQQKSLGMELEKYKSLYSEEQRQRKSLAAKLEKTNARLTETYSQLVCERTKSELNSCLEDSTLNGGALGSLGLNQRRGLSHSSGLNNRVESIYSTQTN